MKKLFLIVFIGFSLNSYSQSIAFFVINSMGSNTTQLTSSVGQTAIAQRVSASSKITDGFLQGSFASTTTALAEQSEINSIICYPNPTSNIINVMDMDNKDYQLLNTSGIQVQQGKVLNNSIDLSNLSQGLYFLQIENRTLKIVKQ